MPIHTVYMYVRTSGVSGLRVLMCMSRRTSGLTASVLLTSQVAVWHLDLGGRVCHPVGRVWLRTDAAARDQNRG